MRSNFEMYEGKTIVFYDGVCGLCNAWVGFLVYRDRPKRESSQEPHGVFYYAPLQGETASKLLPVELHRELSSVVVWRDGEILIQSKAALFCLSQLSLPWRAFAFVAGLIPSGLRDLIYDWVARNRYKWFGKHETCPLPPPEVRTRFLS